MEGIDGFNDIRPFSDEELSEKLTELLDAAEFTALVKQQFPLVDVDALRGATGSFGSVTAFQRAVILPLLEDFVKKTTTSVTASGIENLTDAPAIYMSNHRDIVMDPTLLQLVMLRHNHDTTEIAIGDNLLATDWIRNMVRVNKSFIVRRGLSARDMARVFSQLSAYIRFAVTEKHASVWIAQREGRAKDSDDRTQESIIKMFALSGKSDLVSNLKSLNISPLSISYEYDPCDYLKALEFQHRRDNPDYKKQANEDVFSMQTGMTGFKGRVHYTFTPSINADLEHIAATIPNRKEQAAAICELCDRRIHRSYVIYPINRVAYTLLTGDKHFSFADPEPARRKAKEYLDSRLDLITEPGADREFLRTKLLEMYANPLINHIAAKKE